MHRTTLEGSSSCMDMAQHAGVPYWCKFWTYLASNLNMIIDMSYTLVFGLTRKIALR